MGRSIESTVDQYNDWLTRLARRIPLHAPEATGIDSCRFSRISGKGYTISPERYRPTLTPPVRQLLPDGEVLFRFERDSNGNLRFLPAESGGEQIVAGVRSCDLRAVSHRAASTVSAAMSAHSAGVKVPHCWSPLAATTATRPTCY
jgi:hypothetical protein